MDNRIILGDALETLLEMEDKSVDYVITSPPYNMNLRISKGKYISRQVLKEEFSTKYNTFTDNLPIEEFYQYHKQVIEQLLRVTKNQIFYNISIVTGSKRAFFKLIGNFCDNLKEIIYWDKGKEQPAMCSGVLNRRMEIILVFDNDNPISRMFNNAMFERGTFSDLLKISPDIHKEHKASFPIDLVKTIIENFTREGDIILDPFMGTGTVALASVSSNRKYLGIEMDPYYVSLSYLRLKQIQLSLF